MNVFSEFALGEFAFSEFALDGKIYADSVATAVWDMTALAGFGLLVSARGISEQIIDDATFLNALVNRDPQADWEMAGVGDLRPVRSALGEGLWRQTPVGKVSRLTATSAVATWEIVGTAEPLNEEFWGIGSWRLVADADTAPIAATYGTAVWSQEAHLDLRPVHSTAGDATWTLAAAAQATRILNTATAGQWRMVAQARTASEVAFDSHMQWAMVGAARFQGVREIRSASQWRMITAGVGGSREFVATAGATRWSAGGTAYSGSVAGDSAHATWKQGAAARVARVTDTQGIAFWQQLSAAELGDTLFSYLPPARERFRVAPPPDTWIVRPDDENKEV